MASNWPKIAELYQTVGCSSQMAANKSLRTLEPGLAQRSKMPMARSAPTMGAFIATLQVESTESAVARLPGAANRAILKMNSQTGG